ncbi:hypothetical protein KIN20_027874 [Parelaphostrongylus tenuis]|uniref:Uncharacterized protein n=1 Tax=Parelaphostrongylus tenuis TaxID=148309 RepID=A0AAD5R011_PARTN|nr:hypothetical protein KIN20_027874 [Parelaphostrongylus tenuis]
MLWQYTQQKLDMNSPSIRMSMRCSRIKNNVLLQCEKGKITSELYPIFVSSYVVTHPFTRSTAAAIYCQLGETLTNILMDLHGNSLSSFSRLQLRLERILEIQTRIDLSRDEVVAHFDRNLQLFMCVVDHRLRSLAIRSPIQYQSIVRKLQLLLIDSGTFKQRRTPEVNKLKQFLLKLFHQS